MKTVAILGSSGGTSFAAQGFDIGLSEVGLNTGNALFQYALWDRIKNPKFSVSLSDDPGYVREVADVLVIPAANQLFPGFDLTSWAEFVESVDLPCVVLGLGAQAPIADTRIELPKSVVRFARAISERSAAIGVRGEFTRKVLSDIGVRNAVVTGCPSQMINLGVTGQQIQRQLELARGKRPNHMAVLAGTMQGDTHVAERVLWNDVRNDENHVIIFQMMPEILRFLLEGRITERTNDILIRLGKVVRPELPIGEFAKYLQRHGRLYSDARSWIDAMSRFDLVIGMRIHGAVAAIQAGRLGICVTFDSRTLELAQTMGYPHVAASEICEGMDISEVAQRVLFDPITFSEFREAHLLRMWDIMSEAGIAISMPPPTSISEELFIAALRHRLIPFEKPHHSVPDDFDEVYYMMSNPDLLEARVNPYKHYAEWGKKENRIYKVPMF